MPGPIVTLRTTNYNLKMTWILPKDESHNVIEDTEFAVRGNATIFSNDIDFLPKDSMPQHTIVTMLAALSV